MRSLLLSALLLALVGHTVAQEATGPVTIGGVTYDRVDPGPPFTEAPRPKQDWSPPRPTDSDQAAGMIAFVASDPGDYKPFRIPRPEEQASRLTAFLAQGEQEPVCFAVYALANLQGLSISVSLPDAPLTADARYMPCWPQRTGWRSRQWYLTPELLLPCSGGKRMVPMQRGVLQEQPFDLAAGETVGFWVTLTAQPAGTAGLYHGTVSISGAGRPALNLPLEVEVLPFALERPAGHWWLLYADVARWHRMSDEQVLAELTDFARHGMTGLVEMPLGSPDLSELKSGTVTFDATPFKRLAALCSQAGLPGPHVCSFGGMPERVRDVLGIQCDLYRDPWPQAIKDGVAAVARAAVAATRDAPARWYFYGVDEPAGDNTYAIQEYQCWHQGGALTYATFGDPRFLEQAAAYLTAPCFVSYLISSEEGARAAREGCMKSGAEFWWYGTGSYVNPFPQEGYVFHNRYGAGFLSWKAGARAQVSWTFCRPHEDVFNDFDGSLANSAEPKEQATSYPHLLLPDDWSTYQGAIPTIAWEALREGVDDYCYLATLQALIARARLSDRREVRDAATGARQAMEALVDAIPWTNPMLSAAFETHRMQQVRRAIADQIVNLQAALTGRQATRLPTPQARISVVVRTNRPEMEPPARLPAAVIPQTRQPPTVDGVLDDPCWSAAAVMSDFVHVESGQPAAVPTTARVTYDDRDLYVAFECLEPAMDRLVAKQTGRDTPMVWVDDGVEVFLARADRTRYAHVIVNTAESVYDEINQDPTWNPAVQARVHKAADRWTVELAIPWADLRQAGIVPTPLMALNLCRNRFAGDGPGRHWAWSSTGGGFHVPARFGIAQMTDVAVALSSVEVPRYWGPQSLGVELRNDLDIPVTVRAGLVRGPRAEAKIPARGGATVKVPLNLTTPGPTTLNLSWDATGQIPQKLTLPVTVPEPLTVSGCDPFAVDGEELTLRVTPRVSPGHARSYQVVVSATTGNQTRTATVSARPGSSARLRLQVRGQAALQVGLADAAGRWVAPPTTQRVFALRG